MHRKTTKPGFRGIDNLHQPLIEASVHVEFLQDADIERVNAFHNTAYGQSRTLAQWHWEFNGRIGAHRPFVVAKEGDRIVGTQALMPITMITPEGPVLTAKSEETLVDPSMRGKGVFLAMYRPLLELACQEGLQAIWGFTPAYKPFEGVGFAVPARTQQLMLPITSDAADLVDAAGFTGWKLRALRTGILAASVLSAARSRVAHAGVSGIRFAVLDEPPRAATRLSQEFVHTWGGTTIHRDERYLRWRYFQNPNVRATLLGAFRGDTLLGWLAYSLDRNAMGYLVDTIIPRAPDTPALLRALLVQAVRRLRAAGAVGIRGWHVNGHPFDCLLRDVSRSVGFYLVRRGEPVVLRLEESQPVAKALRQWDQWFVTRAFTQGDTG